MQASLLDAGEKMAYKRQYVPLRSLVCWEQAIAIQDKCRVLKEYEGDHLTRLWTGQGRLKRGGSIHVSTDPKDKEEVSS